jgi:hypothetical protein
LHAKLSNQGNITTVSCDESNGYHFKQFLSEVVNVCLRIGLDARTVDIMIGKGNYRQAIDSGVFFRDMVQVILNDPKTFTALSQYALNTAVVVLDKPYAAFLTYAFEDDVPRLYMMKTKDAPKTEAIKRVPRLFVDLSDAFKDERDFEAHIKYAKFSGIRYLLNENVVPTAVKNSIEAFWKTGQEVARRINGKLDAIVVTLSPTLNFSAYMYGSYLLMNLSHYKIWSQLFNDNIIVDAYLTHEILHQSSGWNISVQNKENFTELLVAGIIYETGTFAPYLLPAYQDHVNQTIKDLAVYKATDAERLKTYFEGIITPDKIIALDSLPPNHPIPFGILFSCAAQEVAAKEKQLLISEPSKRIFKLMNTAPFYHTVIKLMDEIWQHANNSTFDVDVRFTEISRAIRSTL